MAANGNITHTCESVSALLNAEAEFVIGGRLLVDGQQVDIEQRDYTPGATYWTARLSSHVAPGEHLIVLQDGAANGEWYDVSTLRVTIEACEIATTTTAPATTMSVPVLVTEPPVTVGLEPSTTVMLPIPPTVEVSVVDTIPQWGPCFDDGSCLGQPDPLITIPTETVATVQVPTGDTLPATGDETAAMVSAGVGVLLLGTFLLAAARRRVA